MAPEPSIKDKILAAAVDLLRGSGIQKVAQPQVAKAAGVPQGHLTYYFPKRADLMAAVATRFVQMLGEDLAKAPKSRERGLRFALRLAKDRERTRMLLGLIVESESDETLARSVQTGASAVRGLLARFLDTTEDDPDVDLTLATLWGLGLMHFVFRDRSDRHIERLFARLEQRLHHDRPTSSKDPE